MADVPPVMVLGVHPGGAVQIYVPLFVGVAVVAANENVYAVFTVKQDGLPATVMVLNPDTSSR